MSGLSVFDEWFPGYRGGDRPGLVAGVDVSAFQLVAHGGTQIDHGSIAQWAKFAHVKLSEGGTGGLGDRDYFGGREHRRAFQTIHGVPCDGYHFARPSSGRSAKAEADVFLRTWEQEGPWNLAAPTLDAEDGNWSGGDWSGWAAEWLTIVGQATGTSPLLYTYPGYADSYLRDPGLSRWRLWIAEYATNSGGYRGSAYDLGADIPVCHGGGLWANSPSPQLAAWQFATYTIGAGGYGHLDISIARPALFATPLEEPDLTKDEHDLLVAIRGEVAELRGMARADHPRGDIPPSDFDKWGLTGWPTTSAVSERYAFALHGERGAATAAAAALAGRDDVKAIAAELSKWGDQVDGLEGVAAGAMLAELLRRSAKD